MSCNVSINFGFVDVCWLQTLRNFLKTGFIFVFWTFTPPRGIDYSVNWCGAGTFLRNDLSRVRIFNLVALLCRFMKTIQGPFTSPGWWSLCIHFSVGTFLAYSSNFFFYSGCRLILRRLQLGLGLIRLNSFSGTSGLSILCFFVCGNNNLVDSFERKRCESFTTTAFS